MSDIILKNVTDVNLITERLLKHSLNHKTAHTKAGMFAASAKALVKTGVDPDQKVFLFFVPGRIEVLGKHTDYAGGRSVVIAAEQGFCFAAAPRQDQVIKITAVKNDEVTEFKIDPNLTPQPGHWSNYPMTVSRRLSRDFPGAFKGANIAFSSDLPPASGMSSSSAMIAGIYLISAKINKLAQRREYQNNITSRESLAGYLGAVENGQGFGTFAADKGVGTFGGSEDHTAILCCQAGRLSQYSYCPVTFEKSVSLLPDYVFAVAFSGIVAEKTGKARQKYNRASELAGTVVEICNQATAGNDLSMASVINANANDFEKIRNMLATNNSAKFSTQELINRFEHFFWESEHIIPSAMQALDNMDIIEFGMQVKHSQKLAETLLGNQVPETIFLADCSQKLGAVASSAFGAGFGGSVWAMVRSNSAEAFVNELEKSYRMKFPDSADFASFFLTPPGAAAFEL